jgi:hypothetical protein
LFFRETNAAIITIVSDGSLSQSIQSRSGNQDVVLSPNVDSTFVDIQVNGSPTLNPTTLKPALQTPTSQRPSIKTSRPSNAPKSETIPKSQKKPKPEKKPKMQKIKQAKEGM